MITICLIEDCKTFESVAFEIVMMLNESLSLSLSRALALLAMQIN